MRGCLCGMRCHMTSLAWVMAYVSYQLASRRACPAQPRTFLPSSCLALSRPAIAARFVVSPPNWAASCHHSQILGTTCSATLHSTFLIDPWAQSTQALVVPCAAPPPLLSHKVKPGKHQPHLALHNTSPRSSPPLPWPNPSQHSLLLENRHR